jgi:VWFA-related protein
MQRRLRLASLLLLFTGPALIAGQSTQAPSAPIPTFKAQVEYVEVDALVTDQRGQFVPNLQKDDFQVLEDGKRQTISEFFTVGIPVERPQRPLFADRPIEPDVQTNERPFDGRVYVMVLDDLHVAALRSQRVKIAARQFIERNLGANDLMAIVSTGGRAQDAQEFTNNKRLLLAAVDKFIGQKLPSVTINRNNEYFRTADSGAAGGRVPDPDEFQRVQYTRNLLTTLRKVAEWFGGVHGRRKTMLLFSEGIDYDLNDVIRAPEAQSSSASDIMLEIRETVGATARSNVSIYSIDPRGLTTLGDETIEVTQFADANDPVAGAGIGQSSLRNELQVSQDSLRTLADDTGGFAIVNRNDFATAYDRIVADNSTYYVLAYYPPQDKRNGRYHRIDVKVNRPGLVVRARRGYVGVNSKPAPRNTKTTMAPELLDAFNSPLPVSGVPMKVFAAPFKGVAPNASVLVGLELRGSALTLDANSKLEVSMMAADAKGKTFGGRVDTLTLNLRPETRTRVEQTGIRVLNRMDLPPGRYQLRVAARDSAKSNVGSVIYDLDVPDFYKEKLSLSGVALTSMGSGAYMVPKQDEDLKAVLPSAPVAQRAFAQNDEIALFAEVYDNSGTASHKVSIQTTVITDEGRVLYKTDDVRDSSELGGAKGGYGYAARIPLSGIPPGLYVLSIEVRSTLSQNAPITRQIQIVVEQPKR